MFTDSDIKKQLAEMHNLLIEMSRSSVSSSGYDIGGKPDKDILHHVTLIEKALNFKPRCFEYDNAKVKIAEFRLWIERLGNILK